MITVKYEEYHNDYFRKDHEHRFADLTELENWIFEQMQQDYSSKERGWLTMYFPVGEEPSRIQFAPKWGGADFWIHQIENGNGIIFTDGVHTSGLKHWSSEVREWLRQCKERQYSPKFVLVE